MISLCSGWEFTENWSEGFLQGNGRFESVRIPHNPKELPMHYASPADYEMICGYRRELEIPEEYKGKRLFLQFDGAAHRAEVYVNGISAAVHSCGYTAFRIEITDLVNTGRNTVAVKLDSGENPELPPFGFVIDYLTYAGLYREVWLDVRPCNYIEDVFVMTPSLTAALIQVKTSEPVKVRVRVEDDGVVIARAEGINKIALSVPEAKPWSLEHPKLYTLVTEAGSDESRVNFGFRTAEFKKDGFYLNGEKTFLRGLNRHQSWPYIGYAGTESLQTEDARILKHELQCNAVRTSHYPQSQHFIDACDREGLLVFTELPGWQHIGDEEWKKQACENLREMILQYRNHPSVVLWGVRINESTDDNDFYSRTNAIAHELDPSRQTSGVRYIEKSSLLEDVYAYNDFSYEGTVTPVKAKKTVTKDMEKAFLISEHNGHMFPTKPFDNWKRRQEHALRHAAVLNAATGSGEHAGCFGWCMFDYATHKDFGSGDRICYHGVMDSFRNPKLAASLYASQGDEKPVLELGSSMDIGDYDAGNTGDVWIFTNADSVELYKNGSYVATFSGSPYGSLPHGPLLMDDKVGKLLETQEGFEPAKAEAIRECLVAAGKYGLANLPFKYKLKLAAIMVKYHMSFNDGVGLFGKYVSNWGGAATVWRLDAKKNGETVASVTRGPEAELKLLAEASSQVLTDGDTYDIAAVRVRICQANGSPAPYAMLPVSFRLEGAAELIGPAVVTAEGGMTGTYIKTSGEAGTAKLTVSCPQAGEKTLEFRIEKKGEC